MTATTAQTPAGDERSQRGASAIEYALLIALIATVCAVAVQFLGDSVSENYSTNGSQLFPG